MPADANDLHFSTLSMAACGPLCGIFSALFSSLRSTCILFALA